MQLHELTPLLEALLFAADQPITLAALTKAVDDPAVTSGDVRRCLEILSETYEARDHGFKLVRLGAGWQMVTHERYAPWVKSLLAGRQKARLSRAALETAAVIAYKQPITRLGIERIRGVDAGGVLNTLLERSLIMIKGRDPGPGRPLLYGTTQNFLDYFGLAKLTDLPRMDEIAALARAEGGGEGWSEDERVRLEREGVSPEEAVTGLPESDLPDADAAVDPAEQDRRRFREVVTGMTEVPAEDERLREGADADASPEESPDEEASYEPADERALHPGDHSHTQ